MSNKARGPPPQIARCELSQYRDNLRLGKARRGEAMTEKTVDRALGIMRALANEDQWCVVSHPDAGGPCQEPAIGTVWNLCFCRAHFVDAEAAALGEIYEDAERALGLFAGMENERHHTNRV